MRWLRWFRKNKYRYFEGQREIIILQKKVKVLEHEVNKLKTIQKEVRNE
jgi:hypothetical protein